MRSAPCSGRNLVAYTAFPFKHGPDTYDKLYWRSMAYQITANSSFVDKLIHTYNKKIIKNPYYRARILSGPSQRAIDVESVSITFSWDTSFMMTSSNGNVFRVIGLCAGNSPVTGEFPTQRPVTRSFDASFDVHLKKRLSKQPWGWWIETLSWSLWRQCNGSLVKWGYVTSFVISKYMYMKGASRVTVDTMECKVFRHPTHFEIRLLMSIL